MNIHWHFCFIRKNTGSGCYDERESSRRLAMDFDEYGIEVFLTHLPAHHFMYIKDKDKIGPLTREVFMSKNYERHPEDPGTNPLTGLIYQDEKAGEALGVRLAQDPAEIPEGFLLTQVAGGDYLVFQHGPFDLEKEGPGVRNILHELIIGFDYDLVDFEPDHADGRLAYFYFEPDYFGKWVVPIKEKPQ